MHRRSLLCRLRSRSKPLRLVICSKQTPNPGQSRPVNWNDRRLRRSSFLLHSADQRRSLADRWPVTGQSFSAKRALDLWTAFIDSLWLLPNSTLPKGLGKFTQVSDSSLLFSKHSTRFLEYHSFIICNVYSPLVTRRRGQTAVRYSCIRLF